MKINLKARSSQASGKVYLFRFCMCSWIFQCAYLLSTPALCDAFSPSQGLMQAFISPRTSCQSQRAQLPSALFVHSLHTGYEWLAQERKTMKDDSNEDRGDALGHPTNKCYSCLEWFDPSEPYQGQVFLDEVVDTMPLYPLDAVYLPFASNDDDSECHFLNNVEPRNIAMALDLQQQVLDQSGDGLFCAVLRSGDTGRIATVGTILRLVETDIQTDSDGITPQRIRVKCMAEQAMDIIEVVNPTAATKQAKILRSKEYIQVRVKRRQSSTSNQQNDDDDDAIATIKSRILQDYGMVKIIYEVGVGSDLLPPKALSELAAAMPDLDDTNNHVADLWNWAQTWQSMCYTWRSGRQALLSTDRNELMIDAARRNQNGGPLKLPIHLAELQPADRQEIQKLEMKAQDEYMQLQLDPTMDFQVLLSLSASLEKWQWFARLISRERKRLENLAKQPTSAPAFSVDEDLEIPKGWAFEDETGSLGSMLE